MDPFHALADPNRRRIIEMLAREGELSATEIHSRFSVSAPAISQHLKVLREAGLVQMEKRAQQRIYRVAPEASVAKAAMTGAMASEIPTIEAFNPFAITAPAD